MNELTNEMCLAGIGPQLVWRGRMPDSPCSHVRRCPVSSKCKSCLGLTGFMPAWVHQVLALVQFALFA